jgi:hypothetical protein
MWRKCQDAYICSALHFWVDRIVISGGESHQINWSNRSFASKTCTVHSLPNEMRAASDVRQFVPVLDQTGTRVIVPRVYLHMARDYDLLLERGVGALPTNLRRSEEDSTICFVFGNWCLLKC